MITNKILKNNIYQQREDSPINSSPFFISFGPYYSNTIMVNNNNKNIKYEKEIIRDNLINNKNSNRQKEKAEIIDENKKYMKKIEKKQPSYNPKQNLNPFIIPQLTYMYPKNSQSENKITCNRDNIEKNNNENKFNYYRTFLYDTDLLKVFLNKTHFPIYYPQNYLDVNKLRNSSSLKENSLINNDDNALISNIVTSPCNIPNTNKNNYLTKINENKNIDLKLNKKVNPEDSEIELYSNKVITNNNNVALHKINQSKIKTECDYNKNNKLKIENYNMNKEINNTDKNNANIKINNIFENSDNKSYFKKENNQNKLIKKNLQNKKNKNNKNEEFNFEEENVQNEFNNKKIRNVSDKSDNNKYKFDGKGNSKKFGENIVNSFNIKYEDKTKGNPEKRYMHRSISSDIDSLYSASSSDDNNIKNYKNLSVLDEETQLELKKDKKIKRMKIKKNNEII